MKKKNPSKEVIPLCPAVWNIQEGRIWYGWCVGGDVCLDEEGISYQSISQRLIIQQINTKNQDDCIALPGDRESNQMKQSHDHRIRGATTLNGDRFNNTTNQRSRYRCMYTWTPLTMMTMHISWRLSGLECSLCVHYSSRTSLPVELCKAITSGAASPWDTNEVACEDIFTNLYIINHPLSEHALFISWCVLYLFFLS